jgi:hypothetical protein
LFTKIVQDVGRLPFGKTVPPDPKLLQMALLKGGEQFPQLFERKWTDLTEFVRVPPFVFHSSLTRKPYQFEDLSRSQYVDAARQHRLHRWGRNVQTMKQDIPTEPGAPALQSPVIGLNGNIITVSCK